MLLVLLVLLLVLVVVEVLLLATQREGGFGASSVCARSDAALPRSGSGWHSAARAASTPNTAAKRPIIGKTNEMVRVYHG